MSEDEFTKLFKYVQEHLGSIETRLEDTATKEQVNDILNAVDGYAKQAETYMQEMVALAHKVDRLERWINEIAAKQAFSSVINV